MRKVHWLALLVVAALAAACGEGTAEAEDAGGMGEVQEVAATAHDFGITLSDTSLEAGTVRFTVSNEGPSVHEFVIVRSDADPGSFPVEGGEVDEDTLEAVDEIEDIAVGTSPNLEVDLTPGSYVVICNIEGHYAAGMHAGFTVS